MISLLLYYQNLNRYRGQIASEAVWHQEYLYAGRICRDVWVYPIH